MSVHFLEDNTSRRTLVMTCTLPSKEAWNTYSSWKNAELSHLNRIIFPSADSSEYGCIEDANERTLKKKADRRTNSNQHDIIPIESAWVAKTKTTRLAIKQRCRVGQSIRGLANHVDDTSDRLDDNSEQLHNIRRTQITSYHTRSILCRFP